MDHYEQAPLGRILVVEDERIVALDLAKTLEDLGYTVVDSVGSGESAIARAAVLAPDVVLMDIRLSGRLDGIQAAEWIRKNHNIPIIYLTAHADEETLRRAKDTEPFGYLVKPFKAVELRCAIEIALHKHEIDVRLREREQWLATTLRSIGGPAESDDHVAPTSRVAEALTGLTGDDTLGDRLGEITRLVGEPAAAPGTPAAPPTRAHRTTDQRFNVELEARVGERTAALEAANRELEAFSASVAHDLRAPLRHIDGFSQILIEEHAANLGADGVQLLGRVRNATSRMTQLVEDLLRLARIGNVELARSQVDVSAMARAVIDGLRAAHPGRQASVSIADGIVIDADPGLLRIALDNLLGNAWKFTARMPLTEIAVARDADAEPSALVIRDNGAGFDAQRGTLFGAFQRFHSAEQFEGNGMGLAIVERIVKRHGGRIWADSRPGAGATFYVVV